MAHSSPFQQLKNIVQPHQVNTDAPGTPTYFYTRFGIGVSDPEWIEYRLRLFQAVTLPSVSRHLNKHTTWAIAIDENMQPAYKRWLEDITQNINVRLLPVTVFPEAPYEFEKIITENGSIRIIKIDDDDALPDDFIEYIPNRTGLYTMPAGFEVDLANRTMRPTHRPFLSLNTVYHGPAKHARQVAARGHHAQAKVASQNGITVSELQTPREAFIYSRHKQSDSNYVAVARKIREDETTIPLVTSVRRRFGFDEELFQEWRAYSRTAPRKTGGSLWKQTQELNKEAVRLVRRIHEINTEIRTVTRNTVE